MTGSDGVRVRLRSEPGGALRMAVGRWLILIEPQLGPPEAPLQQRELGYRVTGRNSQSDVLLLEEWTATRLVARDVAASWLARKPGARSWREVGT